MAKALTAALHLFQLIDIDMFDALERLTKDKATRHRKLGNVIGRRGKTMLRLGGVARQLLAAREDIGQLARGLLGGTHDAHPRPQRMPDRSHQQRKMRTAEYHGIDTVVLGCTHFPLLVGPIRHALGPGVRVVSSAEETTRELTDILTRREQLAGDAAEPQHRFATTADNIAEFAVAGSFIFGQPLKSIEHIDIDELK